MEDKEPIMKRKPCSMFSVDIGNYNFQMDKEHFVIYQSTNPELYNCSLAATLVNGRRKDAASLSPRWHDLLEASYTHGARLIRVESDRYCAVSDFYVFCIVRRISNL